ncbi:MAG: molybdenum cofactor guanylyltransferase [Caldilineaceae bacterium]|nr:molybdenum cofactor guanylyltransferase [Caldilineaceae bacterium]
MLILAGGSSRRMGRDKLLLPVPPNGIPLVRHVAERLVPLAAKMTVVANDSSICAAVHDLGGGASQWGVDGMGAQAVVSCLADDVPGDGPLGGLATGLREVEDWALTVAGDMPFISAACCRFLIESSDFDCDAVVPVLDGQAQPLHAVYSRRCLPSVERALAAGRRRMDSFWKEVRVRTVEAEQLRAIDPDLLTFTNVNTPLEWEKALVLLSQA